MGEIKGFGTDEHRQRLERSKEEIDLLGRELEAARCRAEDRRRGPDRRRVPRPGAGPDRRRAPSP